jgi:hypothetical protein
MNKIEITSPSETTSPTVGGAISEPTPILTIALELAQKRFPVFPLQPRDKKPLANSRSFKDATLDESVITQMFTANPTANIGIHYRTLLTPCF